MKPGWFEMAGPGILRPGVAALLHRHSGHVSFSFRPAVPLSALAELEQPRAHQDSILEPLQPHCGAAGGNLHGQRRRAVGRRGRALRPIVHVHVNFGDVQRGQFWIPSSKAFRLPNTFR